MTHINITFPDGAQKEYESGISAFDIANGISKSLAKKVLFARIDGEDFDLTRPINDNAKLELITADDEAALELIRHDAAHVMAEAVKELYPETQVTIGPAIENGFYYDFYREQSFTPDDLVKIEKRMLAIVKRNEPITREEWDRDEAVKFFKDMGEEFKAEIIADIPADQPITLYRQGDFIDLCRGPHLPSTGKLGTNFKLMKLAGAYWRGDSNNPMLQRIYGTAWATKDQLDTYLMQLEEAEKRDHRKLAKTMQLLHFQEEAPGSIFWHPKGWTLYQTLQDYIIKKMHKGGYDQVNTPQLLDKTFWEKSGHWGKFRENMFTSEVEDREFAVKPMNCPGHVQIFKQGTKSYRDLPIRYAEFNTLHRNEPSGSLHGMMRLRAFHQDDGHIFCLEDQIITEAQAYCTLLKEVYHDLGFTDIRIKFSDRPEKRAGTDADWDKSEAALEAAAKASGLEYTLNPGEGAFYGPKLEFVLRDAIGRDWQCGTLQCDFILPKRLDAFYVGQDGEKHHPVILHRAVLGSLERFIGILIEHTAGHLPLWLHPVQVVAATVVTDASDYAHEVVNKLKALGIRAQADVRNEKISYKVREHSTGKIPVILAIGMKEAENNQVTMRRLGSQDQTVLGLDEAIAMLRGEAEIPV